MRRLQRLDDRAFAITGGDRLVLFMRCHRPTALLAWAAMALVSAAAGTLAARVEYLFPAWWAALVLALASTVLLVVAIVDDYNAAGKRGGVWGLLFFMTGGFVALVWALDRRLPSPPVASSGCATE